MRIIALDLDAELMSLEPCDIEVPLQRLASSAETLVAARWQKLLDLVCALRADGPYPQAWGHILGRELLLCSGTAANRVTVRLWPDWRDYAPLHDGIPVMHYRLQIQQRGSKLSVDARADNPNDVKEILYDAFGWAR